MDCSLTAIYRTALPAISEMRTSGQTLAYIIIDKLIQVYPTEKFPVSVQALQQGSLYFRW
jgi:exopolyphosphatase/pppGpp-phosphohydrolase